MSATTAAKPLPTAEQLKAYADQLPEIYRDVMSAFSTADPERNYQDDLSLETLVAHLLNNHRTPAGRQTYEIAELGLALRKLQAAGLLDRDPDEPYFTPTEIGEELIVVLTGRRARKVTVPDLPRPTW